MMNMTKEQCINRLELIVSNSCTYDYCAFEISVNDWLKDDKNRTYLAIVERSKNLKVSKHYKKREYGYFDNVTGTYHAGKNDLTENYTFSGSIFQS